MSAERAGRRKLLYKLAVARSDVAAAMSACDLLLEHKPGMGDPLYAALTTTGVVCYGRPFSDNKPLGPIPGSWRRFEDERHQQLHDQLITLRNEAFAHSDALARKVRVVPQGARLIPGDAPSSSLGIAVTAHYYPLEVIEEVRGLCLDLGHRLNVVVEDLLRDLFAGVYAPVPFDLDIRD